MKKLKVMAVLAVCIMLVCVYMPSISAWLSRPSAQSSRQLTWKKYTMQAMAAIHSDLEAVLKKDGALPSGLASYIEMRQRADREFSSATDAVYEDMKGVSLELEARWQVVGRVLVRRSLDGLRANDVIVLSVPIAGMKDTPMYYMTHNLQVGIVTGGESVDQSAEVYKSIGSHVLWR